MATITKVDTGSTYFQRDNVEEKLNRALKACRFSLESDFSYQEFAKVFQAMVGQKENYFKGSSDQEVFDWLIEKLGSKVYDSNAVTRGQIDKELLKKLCSQRPVGWTCSMI